MSAECTQLTGHLPGSDHRWQECPTYHDDDHETGTCNDCGAPDTTGWACCSACWPEDLAL